jgi:hypothetical protein
VTRVEAWADRLLQALVARRALPAFVRGWVLPGDLSGHALQIDFEPTAGGAEVRLLVNDAPLPAWRITTPDGQADDFLPRTVD